MSARFRIPLLASLGAHAALFTGVALLYAPWRERESGASVIAVRLLVEESRQRAPAPPRVREERRVWTPRESATLPTRARVAPRELARTPAAAARAEPSPPVQAAAVAVPRPSPKALPPAPARPEQAMAVLAAPVPTVEEHVSVPAPSLSQREREEERQGERVEGPEGRTAPAVLLSRYGRAAYPRECHRRGEEGTVVLDVEVAVDGKPGAVTIVASSGNARLDAAAVEALRKAAFAPATRRGRPVASVHRVRWVWRLVDADEEE
ncbi:MAG: TonB family protein [Planctomycetes bacterium]|nr:TonB family protein [Planctomycetota bacterium]